MNLKRKLILLTTLGIFAALFLFTAFTLSENITHYHNSFVRRFPQHFANEINNVDLKVNSYYFAGSGGGKIYLGNLTAPLQVMEIDQDLKTRKIFRIDLDDKTLPFRSPQLKVAPPYFYLYEGSVPYIFKGGLSSWKARLVLHSGNYFAQLQPIDSNKVAMRFISRPSGQSVLGTVDLKDTTVCTNNNLLQKQIDGVFDTDGYLVYNSQLRRLVYLYMYRNQYTAARQDLSLDFRGNTIDTISKARIKISRIDSKGVNTFSEPPLTVNKQCATYGNRLYVDSALPGLYEEEPVWKNAHIIDIYDLRDKSYQSSFYIYHIDGKKMRSFIVIDTFLYALIGDKIVRYKFRKNKKLILQD